MLADLTISRRGLIRSFEAGFRRESGLALLHGAGVALCGVLFPRFSLQCGSSVVGQTRAARCPLGSRQLFVICVNAELKPGEYVQHLQGSASPLRALADQVVERGFHALVCMLVALAARKVRLAQHHVDVSQPVDSIVHVGSAVASPECQ